MEYSILEKERKGKEEQERTAAASSNVITSFAVTGKQQRGGDIAIFGTV